MLKIGYTVTTFVSSVSWRGPTKHLADFSESFIKNLLSLMEVSPTIVVERAHTFTDVRRHLRKQNVKYSIDLPKSSVCNMLVQCASSILYQRWILEKLPKVKNLV